ncbi:MAG: MBL fold metallo-hydrolase [Clostridiales bacterium]|nr:MBL fold metallo-hydrolase [Clostridiales bacterium]
MNIKWYGHSCFLLTNDEGVSILTDPCPPSVGFEIRDVVCDAVTISHEHFDHNYIEAAAGDPVIIRDAGEHEVKGVKVIGFPAFHDKALGAQRGNVMMYLFEMDGIRILHAGDVGDQLTREQIAEIGVVDVLLVPIGGKYTLDYLEAREFANSLHPSVVIPMHYKTPTSTIDVDDCSNFVSTVQDCRIHKLNDCEASIYQNTLGEDRVLVLDPYVERIEEDQVKFDL